MKAPDPNAKQVCVTGKEGKFESGQPILSAVLIEPEGDAKKILRVIVPLGMVLQYRDSLADRSGPAGSRTLCGVLREWLHVGLRGQCRDRRQHEEGPGAARPGSQRIEWPAGFTLSMPLGDFAKAYDGPPTDPKVFEEQQKKLQEELQRRAEEARRKLEQGAPPAPGKTQ